MNPNPNLYRAGTSDDVFYVTAYTGSQAHMKAAGLVGRGVSEIAPPTLLGPCPWTEPPSIRVDRRQLEGWAGRYVSDAEVARIAAALPGSSVPAAINEIAAAMAESHRTWTFYGHWEEDQIIVTHHVEGVVQDDRDDDGRWEQGLWAASGSGDTVEEAQESAVAEYRDR